jgi:class 3 adenylate cyclase
MITLISFTRSVSVDVYGFRGADALLGLPVVTIGAVIVRRRARNPIGWLFLAAGFVSSVLSGLAAEYSTYSYARHNGTLPLTLFVTWLHQAMWIPTVGAIFTAAHFFPTGTIQSRLWRIPAILTAGASLLFTIPFLLYPGPISAVVDGVENPYAMSKSTAEFFLAVAGLGFLVGIAAAVVSLIARYRRSRGVEREQIRWLIPALILVLLAMAANIISALLGFEGVAVDKIVPVATMLAVGLMIVAAGVAILRYRLYDIEIIMNRGVVIGVLAAFITIVYVALVAGVGAVIGSRTGSNVALPIVATALCGAAFQPVRHRATRIANRVVYGKRSSPVEALGGLADASSVDDLAERVPRLVVEATALRHATFWLRTGSELRAIASWPADTVHHDPILVEDGDLPPILASTAVYPLEHHGEMLGVVDVAVSSNESILRDDDRLVRTIAAQASHVLRTLLDAVELPTGIVTFLLTDIEGSTRLWEDEAGPMAEALSKHDQHIRAAVARHNGVFVKSRGEGDSTFSAFASPADGIAAALEMQSVAATIAWPTSRPVRVRVALHTGAAQLRDRDYYGPVINRCARLRAIAHGAQTLVTGATYELVRDSLPERASLRDLGSYPLKDLAGEERVFQLSHPELIDDFPPLRVSAQADSARA